MSSRPTVSYRHGIAVAALGLLLVTAACEGDSPGGTGDGGVNRPEVGQAGSGGSSGLGGSGGRGTVDAGGNEPIPPPPPPPINPAAKRILPAGAEMLGTHGTACSYGAASRPANAPRWCAISLPGMVLGTLELWVINVTEAYKNPAAVTCTAGNANCIRLSTTLFGSQPEAGPVYPTSHRFYGETLIYYADALSQGNDIYQGPVYAWQPGWTEGKVITSPKGVLCNASSTNPVAVCIENLTGEETATWDVHAGNINGGPMKKVATIFPVNAATMASQWGSGFTSTGEYFVFSTPPTAMGRETLYYIKTAEIGAMGVTPTMVAAGVSRWTLSADGTKWFYLKDYNYSGSGEPSGNLYTQPFPSGVETPIRGSQVPGHSPTTQGVGPYQVLTKDEMDQGLGLMVSITASRGNYRWVKAIPPAGSADDPMNVITVVNDVARTPVPSDDLRYHYVVKSINEQVGTSDAWLAKSDGTGLCWLTQNLNASLFGWPFTSASSLVFWMDNFDAGTDSGEGWLATPPPTIAPGAPQACPGRMKFSSNIDFWFPNKEAGLLYSDGSDGLRATLRYAPINAGVLNSGVAPLQQKINRMFAILPNYEAVLFQIESSQASVNGIYYLPVTAGGGGADGGVPDGGDAASGN